ncbi:hypothetical protein QWZ13_05830 [Reinekea marina]|nr:hypothetical protein [Reinekea marina]MDN3648425.1 hypothetical protein [Reinekea marina]
MIEARSHFDCLMCGAAFLRQTLRLIMDLNSKLKLFFEFDGKLDEITIDDIFMTHDCVTNEIEDMVDWALENGYKADS